MFVSCGGDPNVEELLGKKRKKVFSAERWRLGLTGDLCVLVFLFLWNDREAKDLVLLYVGL